MSAYSDAVVNDGATTYLRFGETSGTTADDAIGSDDHTYENSPTLGEPSLLAGDTANKAVYWDGTNDRTWCNSPTSALDIGDKFSIEFWVKRTRTSATEYIWSRNWSGCAAVYINSSDKVTLAKAGYGDIASATTSITDTNPHHIVVTKNGSTVKIYIDGSDVTGSVSNQTIGSVSGGSGHCWQILVGNYFKGTLDEFAVYKNVELTSTQIADHYDLGSSTGAVTGSAALSGSGTLTSAGTRTTFGAAALTGVGTLTAASGATIGAAALSGSGAFAASGVRTTSATAALSGTGTLDATGVSPGGAALSGTGTLASTGTRTTLATAALSGSGTLDGSGHRDVTAQAALSGTGTLVGTGTVTPGATYGAALSGTGDLTSAGVPTHFGGVALSGTGTLATTGFQGHDGAASLSGTGVLNADGYATVSTGAGLLGTGVLSAAVAGHLATLAVSSTTTTVVLTDSALVLNLETEGVDVLVGVG